MDENQNPYGSMVVVVIAIIVWVIIFIGGTILLSSM